MLLELYDRATRAWYYLAWLDCRALDLPASPYEFFLERARVALSAGADFGPPGTSSARLNFATSEPILDQILERMATALRAWCAARVG